MFLNQQLLLVRSPGSDSVVQPGFSLRYFQCMPRFGLFAPVHKVTRIGFPCTTPTKSKSSRRRSGLLKRSPSASSISSLSSATSSISGKPSRAGLVRPTLCCWLRADWFCSSSPNFTLSGQYYIFPSCPFFTLF